MSDTNGTTLAWHLDPRAQLHLTGTATDGAAVGWDSLRQHWCRVVHGGRHGEWGEYPSRAFAMRAAEGLLAELRETASVEKTIGPPISQANPW
jgi:hypothetical protein